MLQNLWVNAGGKFYFKNLLKIKPYRCRVKNELVSKLHGRVTDKIRAESFQPLKFLINLKA